MSNNTCTNGSAKAIYINENCVTEPDRVPEAAPWGRTVVCRPLGYSKLDIDMRRKAEVLKHLNVDYARVPKKRQYANAVLGLGLRSRGICARGAAQSPDVIYATSSASGVPGRATLWLDRRVPYVPINAPTFYARESQIYL